MDNNPKRDNDATENIEFELPDTPFTIGERETDDTLPSSKDAEQISVSALFESKDDNKSGDTSRNSAYDRSAQGSDGDGAESVTDVESAKDNAAGSKTPEENAFDLPLEEDGIESGAISEQNENETENPEATSEAIDGEAAESAEYGEQSIDGSSISVSEAENVTDPSEPREERAEAETIKDDSETVGEALSDGNEELFAPDSAPQFEVTEIDIDNDAIEAIVEEVIPVSIIEGSAEIIADNAVEDNDGEAESFSDNAGEIITERARIIPEDLFPDDAFAPPKTDSEGRPIITDLLGNIIEEEILPQPDETEEADDKFAEVKIPEEVEAVLPSPSPEESYNPDKPRRIDSIFDFVELLIFTLVAVLCLTSFFVRHAVVEGGSMMNTLKDGDVLLISDVFYKPAPRDIIVVEDYTTMLKKPIVKRVIAVEGQIVRVTKNAIYVNGKPIPEDYVYTDDPEYEYPILSNEELRQLPGFVITREYYEFMVPEGEIFVMGDHRDDSTDSRVIGTVKVEAVLGKALLRLFPFDKFGEID